MDVYSFDGVILYSVKQASPGVVGFVGVFTLL